MASVLPYFFLVVFAAAFAYCDLGISFFDVKPLDLNLYQITAREFWPVFVLALVAFAGLAVSRPRHLARKYLRWVAIAAVLWLGIAALRIFSVPSGATVYTLTRPWGPNPPTQSIVFALALSLKAMDFATELLFVLFLVAVFCYLPYFDRHNLIAYLAPVIFVAVALASALRTFMPDQIGQYRAFYAFFTQGQQAPLGLGSFYANKNIYGFFLLMGMLSCIFLNEKHPLPYLYWPLITAFAALNAFAACKTVIYLSLVLVPFYFVWCFGVGFAGHPIRNTTVLIVVGALVFVTVGVFFYNLKNGRPLAVNIDRGIRELVGATHTLDLRIQHWQLALALLGDPFRLVFGYGMTAGERISLGFQALWLPLDMQRATHSGYLDLFLRYGLVGLVAFAGLMAAVIANLFRLGLRANNGRVVFAFVLILAVMAVYSVVESKLLFYRFPDSLAFVALPLIQILGLARNTPTKRPVQTTAGTKKAGLWAGSRNANSL